MGRHLVAWAAAASGVLGVIGATPSAALTDGWGDDATHDYVGLAVFYDGDGVASHECAGVLVSDTTFVTAGHCTDGSTTARVWFHRHVGADRDPDTGFDRATGHPTQCLDDAYCVSSNALYDYGFDGLASFPDTRDLGLVILRRPPAGVQGRAELPEPGRLDPLAVGAARNRTVFTVTGYGAADRDPDATDSVDLDRVSATARITQLRSSLNDGFNLQTNGNGSGFGGTCEGGSGAAVFLGDAGSDVVVAITSFGLGGWCRGTDLSYRLDRPEILEWIRGGFLLAAPEPAD